MKKGEFIRENLEGILNDLIIDYRQGRLFSSEITIKDSEERYHCRSFYGFIPRDLIGKEIKYESTIMGKGKDKNQQLQGISIKGEEYSIKSQMLVNDHFHAIHPDGESKWINP